MKLVRMAAVAALAMGAAAAQAGSSVYWSVGVNAAPGVTLGVGNAPPVYMAPAPVYYAPPPPVVYVRPAPVYYDYGPAYVYSRPVVVTKVKVKKYKRWRHD